MSGWVSETCVDGDPGWTSLRGRWGYWCQNELPQNFIEEDVVPASVAQFIAMRLEKRLDNLLVRFLLYVSDRWRMVRVA